MKGMEGESRKEKSTRQIEGRIIQANSNENMASLEGNSGCPRSVRHRSTAGHDLKGKGFGMGLLD